jgi:hypothetical protein
VGEPQPRRASLARNELGFVIEHRPMLDQLIHPDQLSTHGRILPGTAGLGC